MRARERVCVCVHVLSGNFTIVVYEIVGVRLELKVFSFNYINKLWTGKLRNPFHSMTSSIHVNEKQQHKETNGGEKKEDKRMENCLWKIDAIFHNFNNSCIFAAFDIVRTTYKHTHIHLNTP